jgi:hypothetical protein
VIVCRSFNELERMRAAGRLVGEVLTELSALVAPGVTTADLDALAGRVMREHGARSAPLFVGGAKAMGPVAHSHEFELPKNVRALGLRHALSSKAKSGSIVVLPWRRVTKKARRSLIPSRRSTVQKLRSLIQTSFSSTRANTWPVRARSWVWPSSHRRMSVTSIRAGSSFVTTRSTPVVGWFRFKIATAGGIPSCPRRSTLPGSPPSIQCGSAMASTGIG